MSAKYSIAAAGLCALLSVSGAKAEDQTVSSSAGQFSLSSGRLLGPEDTNKDIRCVTTTPRLIAVTYFAPISPKDRILINENLTNGSYSACNF